MYSPVGITAGTSSFNSDSATLDPELFDGTRLKPDVRMTLLSLLSGFISQKYMGVNTWMRCWIAGSGASYRWAGGAGDLDVLIGIDGVAFRRANPSYSGLGDTEIAKHLNDQLRAELWPTTAHWRERYEVTWYVNPHSWDIRSLQPYAAYDLVNDGWTVPPTAGAPVISDQWNLWTDLYRQRAETAVNRYSKALTDLRGATNPAHRRDAEVRFHHAVDESVALFDTVHGARKQSFSPAGTGYADFGNYLWQQGKQVGWVNALRMIKDYHQESVASEQAQTYGLELPDTDTLVRRAAMRRLT